MSKKQTTPSILIVNDDGIHAKGIAALVDAVADLGDITVVAPDKPQSGMGHAVTIHDPLRLKKSDIFGNKAKGWQCTGTPVDCVKLAVDKILHKKPTICLSGINHGANHSINVIYSGTMSAAMEASIESIPSIGFSLLDYSADADFSTAQIYVRQLTKQILENPIKPNLLLNVNIPNVSAKKIKGIKICRQANAKYQEDFTERHDPMGHKYYWLTGKFQNLDRGTDTDVWALKNNYVSVVPIQYDLTNYELKKQLEQQWK